MTIATVASTGSAGAADSSQGVSSKEILVGVVTSITGPASSSFGRETVDGAAARIKLENARGGINGRKLKLASADDGSSPTQVLTATQSLVESKKVFGVIDASALFFGAYRYAVQKGVPVAGIGIDGPEWGDPANKNLFVYNGSANPHYPGFTSYGKFFKSQGGTRACAVGLADSPSSQGTSKDILSSSRHAGLKTPYQSYTTPFGGTSFGTIVLDMKKAKCDVLITEMVTSSNVALITAAKQAGLKWKSSFISGGYQQGILDDKSVVQNGQGLVFQSAYTPLELNTPATRAFKSALATYAGYRKVPTYGMISGWFAADTMIAGLKVAGKNPTWSSFITNLRKVKKYNAEGLIGNVDFSKFGQADPQASGNDNCWWGSYLKGTKFVPVSVKPFCGTAIPGTNNA